MELRPFFTSMILYSGRKGDDEFFDQTGEQYDSKNCL